jgi:hypothetical protein
MIASIKDAVKAVVPYRAYAPAHGLLRYLTSRRYAGGALKCPLCNGDFSQFLPVGIDVPILKEKQVVGGGFRLNAACPRCRSEDRERLVFLYLKFVRPEVLSQPVTLLHVAPEPSLAAALRRYPNISCLSADLNSPMADVQMDITDIHETDETYDVIICNHVLEHIEDDGKAMRELCRILKPGGFAILQVPISFVMDETFEDRTIRDPVERERAFGQRDHVRLYGKDYPARLAEAGFSVTQVGADEFLDVKAIAEYRLLSAEKLFVCSKPQR